MAKMRKLSVDAGTRITVDLTNASVSAGDPFTIANGTGHAAAAADGGVVHGVFVEDGAASATGIVGEVIKEGQIWQVTVSGLSSKAGTKLVAAGSGAFDEGTASDPSLGIVLKDLATTDTTAEILILRETV